MTRPADSPDEPGRSIEPASGGEIDRRDSAAVERASTGKDGPHSALDRLGGQLDWPGRQPGRPGELDQPDGDAVARANDWADDNGQENGNGTASSDERRARLIEAAQRSWVAALTDLGGRNTLLYYKDRRSGTLDLAQADPDALEQFLRTGSIRLTRLFRDVDARADAIRRAQVIYRKARELLEERGIRAAYLATGMARWDELFLSPAAPVLLRALTISPTRARYDDFDLVLDEESEINPVLLHKLATVYGADMDKLPTGPAGPAERAVRALRSARAGRGEQDGKGDHAERAERMYKLLRDAAQAAEVPGFAIAGRMVIGTFTYAKLPMVQDMQAADELLADSDVVAAIAGDPEAQELLAADDDGEPLRDSPAEDYSVLDADSSQRSAIAAVLSGRSLVIHGPPGTGKSQTIANLIAALVTRGRKVLFVAEKRAAIDAVLSRLKGVDLGDLVLDIHEGTRDRQRIARDLGATLDLAQQTLAPDDVSLRRRLADRHRRLADHVTALHEKHPPWGLTAFQVQSALLGIPDAARTQVRLPAPERITGSAADELRDELREFSHLGGFTIRPDTTPWFGAALRVPEDARQATHLAARLSSYTLPQLVDRHARTAARLGLRAPASYAEAMTRAKLYAAIQATSKQLSPAVYGANPRALADAMAGQGQFSMMERYRLRKQATALFTGEQKASKSERAAALADAAAQLAEWDSVTQADGDARLGEASARFAAGSGEAGVGPTASVSMPTVPDDLVLLNDLGQECTRQLDALRGYVRLDVGQVEEQLADLVADEDTAWKLPRLYELARKFDELRLAPLLDELGRAEASPDMAGAAFDHAWYSSILDQIRVRDPRYAAERGRALDEIADDFRQRDVEYLTANRRRVSHAWAERLREAQDRHPLQARVIRKQAALRRGHLPLRRLLDQTQDVLFALKPCWAMSPLMVSQVLPAARLFDVVIFDEASQIVPADAIPSIMRGHQIVVAGDDRQLPPTNFFKQVADPDADPDEEFDADDEDAMVSFGAGFESILDALRPLLPTSPLEWHYRSRDERLVAFSNAHIYGGSLTTFPGVQRDEPLRHVVVAQTPEPGQEYSVTAEVEKVVELVLEHARTRPDESLGVIALGIRHSERIDTELRSQLGEAGNADVEAFFAEDKASEPFFVKNLERVQGDERDAIILSIGYGKHPDGRMRYQWGPLLRDGGERRLNVATTRAKHRLTLVSSFSSHDVDPGRLTKAGSRLLADYLEYAGSGGTSPTASGAQSAELNPFEADVKSRLAERGITVVPQYGVGGYRVDFAATHPDDDERMVLAIEADGASYHRSGSVRDRDRLRGEHLQRLGWSFHRIWSTNWFHDPDSEVAKLQDAYREAVAAAGPAEPDSVPDSADDAVAASAADRDASAARHAPSAPGAQGASATKDAAGAERDAIDPPARRVFAMPAAPVRPALSEQRGTRRAELPPGGAEGGALERYDAAGEPQPADPEGGAGG
jgi:very-short-patch-repair endonuclease